DMPKLRVFFRHTAAIFLAIHKVLLRQIGLVWRKNASPLVTLPIFQTRPNMRLKVAKACEQNFCQARRRTQAG
ncbi:MAG: hypothetical protein IJV43_05985, partial [Oscillospiraceae bacterium]|nr:hypothetical protein [Oscillospiraceae bacterium]